MRRVQTCPALEGASRDLSGRLLALPDAELAAVVRALPRDGAEAFARMVWAMRDVRTKKERVR